MKTTQKEIRNFWAKEITSENFGYVRKCRLETVATSLGIYGVNGAVFYNVNDCLFYKISTRNSYLIQLL